MGFTAAGGALSLAAHGGSVGADQTADRIAAEASVDGVRAASVVAAFVPVQPERAPLDASVDAPVTGLLKSVGLAEERAAEAEAQRSAYERCVSRGSTFGGVQGVVAAAGNELRCRFDVDEVSGVAGRANASDHPDGLALDLMVDRVTGEDLAEYALANRDRLGIEYVIYRQRIDSGDGWERMEDRGGATANHMDHVHISFEDR
ncbi:hypothetical protein [Pseudonocardia sp. MH-G8]|uniref:hypothetical protein n=1 Tax=Pseudonocardia sp. MH-G8 TaxID=1854588 RepID=UPI001E547667|nr:hypothetical protein [Pseudonocardia sp. MH-G8]